MLPSGKPLLAMLLLAIISGAFIFVHPSPPPAGLNVWVFDENHARTFRGDDSPGGPPSLTELYRQRTGQDVRISLIASRALDVRLISLFMSDTRDAEVPDLVEVEIGSAGKYFRPPLPEVGFLPLNKYIERDGLMQRIVPTRFAPWTKQGVIFGIPQDVHPVSLTYRRDLFEAAGVDPSTAKTWAEFQQKSLQAQSWWRAHGEQRRWALDLPAATADYLTVMLLQRGINIIDDQNRLHLDDPRVAETIAFYARLVAGPQRIGSRTSTTGVLWTRDLAQGDVAAALTPDWRINDLRQHAPSLSGRLAMMPLPRFEPSDAPTGTWGGTMMGIPRNCRDPERSWELLKFLCLSPQALQARQRYSQILPPVVSEWTSPAYHRPDPFFGGQKIDELYVSLAARIPPRYVTPFTALGAMTLAQVLGQAVDRVEQGGDVGLEADCQRWLAAAERDLQRRIAFGKFEP